MPLVVALPKDNADLTVQACVDTLQRQGRRFGFHQDGVGMTGLLLNEVVFVVGRSEEQLVGLMAGRLSEDMLALKEVVWLFPKMDVSLNGLRLDSQLYLYEVSKNGSDVIVEEAYAIQNYGKRVTQTYGLWTNVRKLFTPSQR